jgi:aminoglycoside phosphotransferase (APT) family kinase protein
MSSGTGTPKETVAVDPNQVVKLRKALLGDVDYGAWKLRLGRLMTSLPGAAGEVDISDLVLPSGGGSSGTLLFTAAYKAHAERRYVLRYATEGGLFHSYNVPGQYSILKALEGSGVPVPRVVGEDPDGSLLGVVGYVMEYIEGETPPPSYYRQGLILETAPGARRLLVFDTLKALAALHRQDPSQPGFGFLWRRGAGATALARNLDWHWTSLLWGCPHEQAALQPIYDWLIANQPAETGLCVCHGDAMLANYMFHQGRLVAILDWELAFIGMPACDIAWQVMTNASLGVGCAPLAGMPSEAEWLAAYEDYSGAKLANWNYCAAYTAFILHGIMLLVYRAVPPELEAARDAVRDHTTQELLARLAAAGWRR